MTKPRFICFAMLANPYAHDVSELILLEISAFLLNLAANSPIYKAFSIICTRYANPGFSLD